MADPWLYGEPGMTGVDHDGEGGRGGRGGGRVRIVARGPLHMGQTTATLIEANGLRGENVAHAQGGGGSGGSIQLHAQYITGTGSIRASGSLSGSSSNGPGGCGSGGRIHVKTDYYGGLSRRISLAAPGQSSSHCRNSQSGTVLVEEGGLKKLMVRGTAPD